jgi:2-polyprenyl-3-methyl-5-hydroxy-6-metoxy-1,4-benzoquinol methylase
VYVNPAPHLEALIDYYNNCACNAMLQDLYKKRSVSKSSPILDERVQSIVSLIRARIEHQVGPVSVLEIGCGSGRFLANLKGVLEQQGLSERVRLVGVDIDRNAVALNSDDSLELHGLPIEEFAEQTLEQFDVVLHFELIEHLGDPAGFVQRCRGLLKQGGAMVFTTPNDLGFENVASGYNGFRLIAHSIFPPMHLNAFSTQNIAVFLLRCGFAVKSIATPGNLDADMVSLMKSDLDDPVYRAFVELSDQEKALFQQLVKKLSCSSHMLVVAGI